MLVWRRVGKKFRRKYGSSHKVEQLTSESRSFFENSEKYAFLCCECNVRYVVPNQRLGCVV